MKCPKCQSRRTIKNGRRRGKQCYRCHDCGRQFVESPIVYIAKRSAIPSL